MDRFVDLGRRRGGSQPHTANGGSAAGKKMAAEEKEREKEKNAAAGTKATDAGSQNTSPEQGGEEYDKIVTAVSQLIKPLIREAVTETIQAVTGSIR